MTEKERLELYVSPVPNKRQKRVQDMAFYAFLHYGMTTFTGKEWGSGRENPEKFNPSSQDTDQWISAIKSAGMKGAILTAKHHDGFCLWQTETTEHSVKNSSYKGGHGDVVREFTESCRKYGLQAGLYLSPWDRNSKLYGTPAYNDFYIAQLTELLTGYGDLFCIWMDGACGENKDGKPKQIYDFERIYSTVYSLQPDCAISVCGPDIRWVGNEGGRARESEWNVVGAKYFDTDKIAADSQQSKTQDMVRAADWSCEDCDLGSREALEKYDSFMWYPAEVDVSVRPGWFYHKHQDKAVRSLDNLMHIYNTSVGGNSTLLLNIPPDRRGLLAKHDCEVLEAMGNEIQKMFSAPVTPSAVSAPGSKNGFDADGLLGGKTYSPEAQSEKYELCFSFDSPVDVGLIVLVEDTDFSQRIEAFTVYAETPGGRVKLYEGTTVGFRRFAHMKNRVKTDKITISVDSCRLEPYIKSITFFM